MEEISEKMTLKAMKQVTERQVLVKAKEDLDATAEMLEQRHGERRYSNRKQLTFI